MRRRLLAHAMHNWSAHQQSCQGYPCCCQRVFILIHSSSLHINALGRAWGSCPSGMSAPTRQDYRLLAQ